ncbi:MAG: DUF4180 domain-containing protein [Bacteroidales bacterium]|nr:DUF4180 domain-containing protein [Bacteroidales bacterium]
MEFIIENGKRLAIASKGILLIKEFQDALDLMGDLYYQGVTGLVLFESNLTPDFFDLKTRLAGDILQKFSTYRFKLAIVGDFLPYTSKSLQDFIRESNKQKHINFVSTREEAIQILSA